MTPRESEIIELIRREVKPALGCTEPIAVALAVAKAMETISDSEHDLNSDWRKDIGLVRQIDVKVSGNILKNGMGVGIPGTGMVGLHIAAALIADKQYYKFTVNKIRKIKEETSDENQRKLLYFRSGGLAVAITIAVLLGVELFTTALSLLL